MSYQTQNDLILASLALQLGKPNGHQVGQIPSDEELAAMADNRLDAVRRAQIMSHIANNAATYQRLVSVAQAVADFSDSAVDTARDSAKSSDSTPGIFSRILSSLFGNSLRAGVLGGGVATAAMVFAVVILLPSLDEMSKVNDIYSQWSPDIKSQWDPSEHSAKFSLSTNRAFKIRTEAELILTYGYHSGAKTLGIPKYQALGIPLDLHVGNKPRRSDAVNKKHYKSLLALGRLTALTTLQCELSHVNRDFGLVFKTVRHLSQQLLDIADTNMAALVSQFPQQGVSKQKQAVCEFTGKVVASL